MMNPQDYAETIIAIRTTGPDTDMIFVVLTLIGCYCSYRPRQLVCHRHDGHTVRTPLFQFRYPGAWFFTQ